jgi:hypothetical protein
MIRIRLVFAVAVLGFSCTAAQAQWSIGAPGKREAPAGLHRYAFLVFANPIAGKEVEFNDWYDNVHIGDLVQMPGWVGAQRFRIVPNVDPRPTAAGYNHGYLIVWEIEETGAEAALNGMVSAIAGGRTRRGAAFNYTPGAGAAGTYEIIGPRITRPDGKGPTMPAPNDYKSTRPARYMFMEFSEPLAGKEAEFNETAAGNIRSVLSLPGWMAAQRFQAAFPPGVRWASGKPRYMTIWETEGVSAQSIQETLNQAMTSGAVKKNAAADPAKAESVYWEPITAYITKGAFVR